MWGGREDALAPGSPGEQGRGHFRAIFNVVKDVPAAKAALKHFTSFEFVVWCNILRGTSTELAFAELVGQKSDSTFGDVDRMWRHARRVATNVKEKRYCRTTLQDMGTVLVCKDKGGGALAKPPPSLPPPPRLPLPEPPLRLIRFWRLGQWGSNLGPAKLESRVLPLKHGAPHQKYVSISTQPRGTHASTTPSDFRVLMYVTPLHSLKLNSDRRGKAE